MQETNLIEQGQEVERTGTEISVPAPTMTLCSYGNKLTREELAQCVQGAGANTPVQGDGQAGGVSTGGPTFLTP